jgi:large subunit ribosomal protein L17
MRHRKHSHVLGVKTAHRRSLVANLASALFTNARITTTLSRAKAIRPFAEQIITYLLAQGLFETEYNSAFASL